MKNWTNTIALALTAATLTLSAACTEDDPGSVADVPAPEPGDPAIYAPDGWPLQIGDRTTRDQRLRLQREFLHYGGIIGMHLVGDQVYGAEYSSKGGPTVYTGHFPKRAYTRRENEHRLPPEFHGKIEYYPPPVDDWYINADGERRIKHYSELRELQARRRR